ncbi:MAG: hypothetical protein AMXMBFR61_10700 [Fimbriimonadales bacterium]
MSDSSWAQVMEELRQTLNLQHQGREAALPLCRQVVQSSSRAIRSIHRKEFDAARAKLDATRQLVREMQAALAPYPELCYSNYRSDAEKEYVEGEAVLAMVLNQPLPNPEDLEVTIPAYLNGMAEAASECRRYVLDLMRAGNLSEADRIMATMEEIYDELITVDFPDSLTGGLRRACDALRTVLERTRSDLALTHIQTELLRAIGNAMDKLNK